MPLLNLNYGFLIYEDQTNTRNPDIRTPDITRQIEGVCVDFDKSERKVIYPNETKDIAVTSRTLGWSSASTLEFVRPLSTSDNMRLFYTGAAGTAPSFVTNRNIGGSATTTVTITRVTNYVARISVVSGTSWSLGSVVVNDFLRFEKTTDAMTSLFDSVNQGRNFLVQAKGANYIDFVDNGEIIEDANITLGADFASMLKVISQDGVKVGDTIEISGSTVNPSNYGRYEVISVSDDYVEFVSPLGVEEAFTLSTNSIVIYEFLIGFMHIRASAPLKIKFGVQTEWTTLGRLGPECIFIGSISTHRIQAFNDSPGPVTISVQTSVVLG